METNKVLPDRNRDHALSGGWNGYRECHIKPDPILLVARGRIELPTQGFSVMQPKLLPNSHIPTDPVITL